MSRILKTRVRLSSLAELLNQLRDRVLKEAQTACRSIWPHTRACLW